MRVPNEVIVDRSLTQMEQSSTATPLIRPASVPAVNIDPNIRKIYLSRSRNSDGRDLQGVPTAVVILFFPSLIRFGFLRPGALTGQEQADKAQLQATCKVSMEMKTCMNTARYSLPLDDAAVRSSRGAE